MIETEKSTALFNLAKTALSGSRNGLSKESSSEPSGVDEVARLLQQETAQSKTNRSPAPPPLLNRASSMNSSARLGNGQARDYEWRRFLTVEERQAMRDKIRSAYMNACTTYDDLLKTVVAIEEELLHISAPSRLDYFKSGCQFDKRVHEKRKQFLQNDTNDTAVSGSEEDDNAQPNKKARETNDED